MKIFLFNGELNLGEVTPESIKILDKLFDWLDDNNVTSRYKSLVLSESYLTQYDDGEPLLVFN